MHAQLLATAAVVRHPIPIPFMAFGLLIARWPEELAGLYAKVFRDLGFDSYRRAYESQAGIWFVRAVGVAFLAGGAYWAIVGTG